MANTSHVHEILIFLANDRLTLAQVTEDVFLLYKNFFIIRSEILVCTYLVSGNPRYLIFLASHAATSSLSLHRLILILGSTSICPFIICQPFHLKALNLPLTSMLITHQVHPILFHAADPSICIHEPMCLPSIPPARFPIQSSQSVDLSPLQSQNLLH